MGAVGSLTEVRRLAQELAGGSYRDAGRMIARRVIVI
jgi:hypothetical protein